MAGQDEWESQSGDSVSRNRRECCLPHEQTTAVQYLELPPKHHFESVVKMIKAMSAPFP